MKRAQPRRLSVMRIVITASVILGLVNIILVGATYQRQSASRELDAENSALEENINSLKKINHEELVDLQEELDLIRADVVELEASFPELGAPFAIYQQALELSQESQVDLISIVSQSTDLHETYSGTVVEKLFSLDFAGATEDCISFIGKLEQAGRDTLSMKSVNLLPLDNSCSIEVSLLGYSVSAGE